MNQIENSNHHYTNEDFDGVACIVEPMVSVTTDQTFFLVTDYITPDANFRTVYYVDLEQMAGFVVVEKQYAHVLEAIQNDPRPGKMVGEPECFDDEYIPPAIALLMMAVQNAPELLADAEHYTVFPVAVATKQ